MVSETTVENYTIERLSKSRLKDLEQLYRSVYNRKVPEGFFQKKYNTAYTGVENIGYVAYDQNSPVAYYGVMPCFIEFENKIVLAAQSGDTMTHPAYRSKMLFVKLAKMTYELCRSTGIEFVFGFPNQNSCHGVIKHLGGQMTERMECFQLCINSIPLNSFCKKFKLSALYKKYAQVVLKKYVTKDLGTDSSAIADGFASVKRSEEYLNYKAYSKTKVIQIGKAKVWMKINTEMNIGDIELNDEDPDKLIEGLKSIASKLGLQKIYTHACTRTSLYHLWHGNYKNTISFPVMFVDLGSSIPFEKIKFCFADIDIF
jgi:hypothetical protein